MSDTKYNGWTNYATWRVNLEIFDGNELDELFDLTLPVERICSRHENVAWHKFSETAQRQERNAWHFLDGFPSSSSE